MSKAFTREDDGAPTPEILPEEEWPLPEGVKYYATPEAARRLPAEHAELRDAPRHDDAQTRLLERRRRAIERRLQHMEIVDPAAAPRDRVAFGARVTVETEDGGQRAYRIVGIDDVDPRRGWVSYVSPVARALLGARVGDAVTLRSPRGAEELEVVAIDYDEP
jgi:transcription elongation factor GreB